MAYLVSVTLACVGVYGLMWALYSVYGFQPFTPWSVAFRVVVIALPMAFGLNEIGRWLGRVRIGVRSMRLLAAALGTLLIVCWRPGPLVAPIVGVLIALLVVRVLTSSSRRVTVLALAAFVEVLWLQGVKYANYVVVRLAGHRLIDPSLMRLDAAVYATLLGVQSGVAVFPLTRVRPLFLFFENAYLTLAVQPMLVPVALVDRPREVARFFTAVFGCYAVGALVFLVAPAVGPTLYVREAFDPAFAQSMTGATIAAMSADLQSVLRGGQPVNGFGYFIALPSLHAAMACICQYHLRWSPGLFWMMLPVNVTLVASTVVLGQHYLLDAGAGVLLGVVVSLAVTWVDARYQRSGQ